MGDRARTNQQKAADALDPAAGLFGDIETEQLELLFEHELHAVDENAGNGITDKFFDYDSGVSRDGPDVVIGEGEFLRTKERGDYGAGKTAIPGAAARWTQAPTGDQDAWVGYYDEQNGIGGGIGYKHFSAGENGATSAGAQFYAFFETGGEGRTVVPAENANLDPLDGSTESPNLDPTDGLLVRFPHAAYGHARFGIEIGIKTDSAGADFEHYGDAWDLYPFHVFTQPGSTMWDEFDLPIEWHCDGTQGDSFAIRATACHYQGDPGRGIKRLSGEGFTPQKNGGSAITLSAHPAWTYLLSYRKRSGWAGTSITPVGFSLNANQNVEVQITVGGDFNATSYALPDDTGETEGAVEYDIKTWDLATDSQKTSGDSTIGSTNGRREYYDTIPGDKQNPVAVAEELDNVVATGQEPIALLARPATGTATDVNFAALRNGSNF